MTDWGTWAVEVDNGMAVDEAAQGRELVAQGGVHDREEVGFNWKVSQSGEIAAGRKLLPLPLAFTRI